MELFAGQAAASLRTAQLFEARAQFTKRLESLRKVTRVIAADLPKLEDVLDRIVASVENLFETSECDIRLYNVANDTFYTRKGTSGATTAGFKLPRPGGSSRHVLNSKQAFYAEVPTKKLPNGLPAIREELQRSGIQAMAVVPLISDRSVIGLLYLEWRHPTTLSPDDKHLLALFADETAIAIENSQLYKQRAEDIAALQQINAAITKSSVEEITNLVVQKAADLLKAGYSDLWILDGDKLKRSAYHPQAEDIYAPPLLLIDAESLNGYVAKTRKPHRTGDAQNDTHYYSWRKDIQSSMSVPLLVGDRLLGTLGVESTHPDAFSFENQKLLESLGAQAAIALENADLFVQVKKQREEQIQAIKRIGIRLSDVTNLDIVLDDILGMALDQMGTANLGEIRLYDLKEDVLRVHASRGEIINPQFNTNKIGEGVTGWVAEHRKSRVEPDTSQLKGNDYLPFLANTRSEIATPLLKGDELLGVLNIESPEMNVFSDEDIPLIEAIASQVVIAFENARLYQQRLADIAALQEINTAITQKPLNEVAQLIVQKAAELTDGEYSGLWLVDEERKGLKFGAMHGIKPKELWIPLDDESFNGYVALTGKTYNCKDLSKTTHYYNWYGQFGSRLGTPMKYQDTIVGTLYVHSPRFDAFTDYHANLLESLAAQAAVAIENSRSFEATNAKLVRKLKDLEALYQMGQFLTSGIQLSEPEIIALIDEQATHLMDTENMYIAMYDTATDTVRFPLMRVNGELQKVDPRSGGHGRTEWIIQNKEPIFISTKAESQAWYTQPREEYIGQAFASWIGVPMVAGEEVIGVIAAYHEEQEYVYSEDDLEILRLMANQAAIALKSAQQLDLMRSLAVDLSAGILDV